LRSDTVGTRAQSYARRDRDRDQRLADLARRDAMCLARELDGPHGA
jgi:hypothetical protein